MKKTAGNNLAFLLPYVLFLMTAGAFLSVNSKGDAHILLNQYRYEFCDAFFPYATFLGDFSTVIAAVLLLCFLRYRLAVFLALSNAFSAVITQLLKHTVFADVDRPIKFFEGIHQLNLVAGYENYSHNSFPSGHTTSAFTTFFCLALLIENRALKFLMFILAFLVALSRVYLSQHFLNDVYAGSLIGVTVSFAVYHYLFISERTKNITWLERSFLKST